MALLQQQVTALTSKLVDMERKVAERESKEDRLSRLATSAREVPELARKETPSAAISFVSEEEKMQLEQTRRETRKKWKSDYFGTETAEELIGIRTRRPDEDFFLDVISIFDHLVPGWNDASIDAAGILDLHGGSVARTVPFMAILLVVPAYMFLPIAALRLLLRGSAVGLKDRMLCLSRAALLGWFAWAPLLYCIFGDVWGDVRRHETTFLTFSFPWWALAWFGYAIANRHLLNACDSAVENMKAEVASVKYQTQRAAYGSSTGESWFRETLQALASPSDGKSLYPMFAISDEDEPADKALDKWKLVPVIALVSLQVMYALYPCIDVSCGPWALVINATSAVAIGYAAYCFCYDLGVKMIEFKDCVDEVRTFLFMVCPPEVRHSRRLRDEFLSLVLENISGRKHYAVCKSGDPIQYPGKAWKEFVRKMGDDNRHGFLPVDKELDLEVRRVELNLSTVPGVALFQHLQGWVWADIVNERFAIDTSASILCFMLALLMGVALVPVIFEKQLAITHVSLTQGVACVDIMAMLVYIGLCCTYCVNMNELIFNHSDRVLQQWKGHARAPSAKVATVYVDAYHKDLCAPPMSSAQGVYDGPMEVRAMIDLTRERLRLHEPQKIMGMKVTTAFRAKLLSTLGGATVAVGVSLVKKHFGGD